MRLIRSVPLICLLLPMSSLAGPFFPFDNNPYLHNYGLVNYANVAATAGFQVPASTSLLSQSNVDGRMVEGAIDSKSDKVCLSESCVITSANLLKQMNRDVNPCDDFYKFACGGFIDNTVLPEHKTRTGKNTFLYFYFLPFNVGLSN